MHFIGVKSIKTTMKEHLVNLLYEQYKLTAFEGKLFDLGIEINSLHVNNHPIILDIIGFPKDNQKEYSKRMKEQGIGFDPQNPPDGFFSRDDLVDHYYKTLTQIGSDDSVVITWDGLMMAKKKDEDMVKRALTKHIDWLYRQFQKLEKVHKM